MLACLLAYPYLRACFRCFSSASEQFARHRMPTIRPSLRFLRPIPIRDRKMGMHNIELFHAEPHT